MGNSIPIVVIVIGVILVAVALLVWTKRKEVKLELERINDKRKKAFFAQFWQSQIPFSIEERSSGLMFGS